MPRTIAPVPGTNNNRGDFYRNFMRKHFPLGYNVQKGGITDATEKQLAMINESLGEGMKVTAAKVNPCLTRFADVTNGALTVDDDFFRRIYARSKNMAKVVMAEEAFHLRYPKAPEAAAHQYVFSVIRANSWAIEAHKFFAQFADKNNPEGQAFIAKLKELAAEQKKAEERARTELEKYHVECVSVLICQIKLPQELMDTQTKKVIAQQQQAMFTEQRISSSMRLRYRWASFGRSLKRRTSLMGLPQPGISS